MSHTSDSEEKKIETESCSADLVTTSSRLSSEKDCAKKIRHGTAKEARIHIVELSDHGKKPFGSYYHCVVCHGYHVTSRPAKGQFRRL